MARYFRFINSNIKDVERLVNGFNKQQTVAFNKLNYVLNNSLSENSAFWDMFLCTDMRAAFSSLVEKHNFLS